MVLARTCLGNVELCGPDRRRMNNQTKERSYKPGELVARLIPDQRRINCFIAHLLVDRSCERLNWNVVCRRLAEGGAAFTALVASNHCG
jgi:hypothetical protein